MGSGKYSINSTSGCKDCGIGKFNDLEGQLNCKDCGQGKFNDLQGQSDESVACQVWQDIKCNPGYKRVNGNATSDANCVQCGQGQFQSANQFNGTSCTDWKRCNSNEYSSFNGNRTSNRICLLKATTTTAAPTTTTAAPTASTTTN